MMDERRAVTGFKEITLFKDDVLGIGSYGKVCRAKCDDLVCAAKILHQTLFDPTAYERVPPQRGHRLPAERFEKECEFMSALKHPNIVQYLGLVRDYETGLKVLLMELMDDSLTHFLESSTQQIPYHIQVNVCHDITLALSFLHSNDLIHRDLSSNNVLLTKGSTRAKVTDFGMTQLYNLNPFRTNTTCPGTAVYMPPEALQGRPEYTEKIDCFSFGVIVLQVLTRQYPNPADHQRKVEINHPGVPRGQLMVCVPEIERRNNHIRLVDPHHSLLPIIQDCLRDEEGERPTARQLCERVAILKYSSTYGESEKVNLQQVQGLQQILKSQTKRLDEKVVEIQKLRQELGHGGERDQMIAQLYQTIEIKDRDMAKKREENDRLRRQLDQARRSHQIIQRQDRTIAEKEGEIQRLRWQLDQANAREREKYETNYQKEQVIGQKQRRIEQLEEMLRQKDQRIMQLTQEKENLFTGKDQEIRLLRIQLQQATLQERAIAEVKPENEQKIGQIHVAEGQVRPLSAVKLEGEKSNVIQENRPPKQRPGASERVEAVAEIKKLRWREGPVTPKGMKRASNAAVSTHDNMVYILPYSNHDTTVYNFDIATSVWSSLKSFPYRECSLAIIKDLPTVIGGKQGLATYYNSLFSFTGEGKWTKMFASMPTARANSSVTVIGENVFVIGGNNADGPLNIVEVMNTETQQWIRLAAFPVLMMNASITTCGGNIYVLGGRDGMDKASKLVYTCSLEALLSNQPNAWQKIADLPPSESTCVSLHGRVLAIGGVDATNQSGKSIYMYEQATNSWKAVTGEILSERHSCFVAVLPDNQLMVVGGVVANNQTNSVEFGSIE